MNFEYMDKAVEKITNIPMLVNLISYRTRQLNAVFVRWLRRIILNRTTTTLSSRKSVKGF